MKTREVVFYIIVPMFLAIPCLYYGYLMLFNPVIASLTPESLALRLIEGQKSLNYTVSSLGKPAILLFSAYIVVVLIVLVYTKLKRVRAAK